MGERKQGGTAMEGNLGRKPPDTQQDSPLPPSDVKQEEEQQQQTQQDHAQQQQEEADRTLVANFLKWVFKKVGSLPKLFARLDVQRRGTLTCKEFCTGLKRLDNVVFAGYPQAQMPTFRL